MVKAATKTQNLRSELSRSNTNRSVSDVFYASSTLHSIDMSTFSSSRISIFLHLLTLAALSSLCILPYGLKNNLSYGKIPIIMLAFFISYFVFYAGIGWATTYFLCYISDKQPGLNIFHIVLGCYTYVPLSLLLYELSYILRIVAYFSTLMASDYYVQINFINNESTSGRTRVLLLIVSLANIIIALYGGEFLSNLLFTFAKN